MMDSFDITFQICVAIIGKNLGALVDFCDFGFIFCRQGFNCISPPAYYPLSLWDFVAQGNPVGMADHSAGDVSPCQQKNEKK